jgi:large subunit ribosomal protein L18
MAINNRYTLKLRRRREGRTDYKKRLSLLKSREPRVVVRRSNNNTIVQVVEYRPDGDVILAQASTAQLPAMGWKAHTGNLPAAYLAGYLAGARAKKAKVSSAIADLGMRRPQHGGRLFAALKGVVDAGIKVPLSEAVIPSEERLQGTHIDATLSKAVDDIKKKAGA